MTGPGEIEVQHFARPEPEPGAVLMRVSLSGICGTDKHTFRGETVQYAGTLHERQIRYPLICGHENVGVVEATGGKVLAADGVPLRPGDRIVPAANVTCGGCWYCLNNQPTTCVSTSRTTATRLTCRGRLRSSVAGRSSCFYFQARQSSASRASSRMSSRC